jgi:hypothetical protein
VLTARHERACCAAHQAVENGFKGLNMALAYRPGAARGWFQACRCCCGVAGRSYRQPLQWQQQVERFRRANGARASDWDAKLL